MLVTYHKWEVSSKEVLTGQLRLEMVRQQIYTIGDSSSADLDKFIKATYTYTDKQGNSYSKEWISDSAVEQKVVCSNRKFKSNWVHRCW